MSRQIGIARAPARPLLLTLCSALLFGATALTFNSGAIAATKKSTGSGEKKLPSKVRFIDSPSSETPAARKKRLKIECKGRPNAGACLGHTR
ncbi:hypothetical protein LPB72_19450 [Hydrogenophaga crassostreae]|uniref:Uncharacterized protein n=1 Tax=Hydrogenophaga crassostreae TaxID=1763535 RepID=A0A162YS12_9BURK|nr:hypothetical protein [Hydrogenophaga crassostreae]AOW11675.1 hypothetical protein LPB072_01185 [Hydrogenophaga crassostreae]OAD39767.1 hypothetical protein LPB72_19450 [Hydrogenophaga crassostreae]